MKSAAGRVLGLALVMMLVMSVVGLAGTKTFINKTGKTVTGITITFSKDVRITRHDSAFPDQSPSGRSDEFTFDGGSLRNLGRFTVTWMPSSGKVTDYEWIEKAEPAQATQGNSPSSEQEFRLPDPNTPPILYGNDYPGPDEPKYQPAPDEQIWLTDLDGHGGIYDNDSIRINYAPGFDVSQITKIEVYRNGIKLRFVPEKLDVLTNAQMKTFDGNPAEHSPASSHTDHAIMGYEYEFKISTPDHLWILKKTVKSGFRWRPKEVWGYLQTNWMGEISNIQDTQLVEYFRRLGRNGFTGISVDVCFYMNNPYDDEVRILPQVDTSIISWYGFTPSKENLETVLKAISEAGVDAHVRGEILISEEYQNEHGFSWSSEIEPKNPGTFFDGYTTLWIDLIPILNKYNVKLLTPFTEMDGIEKYSDLIEQMYSKLSETFTGELGFEEATNLMLKGQSPVQNGRSFQQMARTFTFWDWADSKGLLMRIEYSSWDFQMETQEDQRLSVIGQMFKQFWSQAVSYYSSTYPNNQQMFGEIGARDADGYVLGPDYYYSIPQSQRKADEQERADLMYSIFKASKGLGIESLNIWQFLLCDLAPNWKNGAGMNIGYALPPSPEYRVITAIIAPEGE